MLEKIKHILKLNRKEQPDSVESQINDLFKSLSVDELRIIVGEDLVKIAPDICERVHELRRKMKDERGFIMPAVRILDDLTLQENEYRIQIKNNTVFSGYTVPKEDYACNEISKNLEESCMQNLELVFTNEITEKYINAVQSRNGWLVWNVSHMVPVTGIKIILVNLLKNGKSINDITYVFEKICEVAAKDRDWYTMRDPYKIAKAIDTEIS